jgi:hypothetical protein
MDENEMYSKADVEHVERGYREENYLQSRERIEIRMRSRAERE